jgi:hypothetical protein
MRSCVRTIVIHIFRIKTILFIDHSCDFADGFYLVFVFFLLFFDRTADDSIIVQLLYLHRACMQRRKNVFMYVRTLNPLFQYGRGPDAVR